MKNYRAPAARIAAVACIALAPWFSARAQVLPRESSSPAPDVSASPQPADDQNTVTVPRGVIVPILVTKDVRVGANGSSQEEHRVKLAVDQDVIVDGYVIAKAGDLVEGRYDTQTNQTNRTFEKTTSQELELDIDDLVNFCGDTIHLKFTRTFVGGTRSGFLSFGVHEHDAVVGRGDVLQASTDRVERHVCAEPTTASARPLPKNIITPDAEMTPPPVERRGVRT
jgi:hypothetical protein